MRLSLYRSIFEDEPKRAIDVDEVMDAVESNLEEEGDEARLQEARQQRLNSDFMRTMELVIIWARADIGKKAGHAEWYTIFMDRDRILVPPAWPRKLDAGKWNEEYRVHALAIEPVIYMTLIGQQAEA